MKNAPTQPSYFFSEDMLSGSYGVVQNFSKKDIQKQCDLNPTKQTIVTLQFKIKSLKPSLIAKLRQGAMEVNTSWNYCNEISHKAIADRHIWLTHFDLNRLMTGNMRFSDDNPFGFKVINNAVTQCVAAEYVTRREQFNKSLLRWRKSTGSLSSGRSTSWIPFKEEHINITYPYSFIQTTTTQKIKTHKKTGEQTICTVVKETTQHKTVRVAGKNTPVENLYALYSMHNDSGSEYGLPRCLGTPTIKVLGTHLKVFNEEYLGYYLYHLGAIVKSGSITENTIGEWFVNLAVAIDADIYREKHCFGKLKINPVAQREKLGLDPGAKTMVVASDGTEYYANGKRCVVSAYADANTSSTPTTLSDNPPLSPYLVLEEQIKQAQCNNDWDQVRRLYLKAKNQLKDATSKAALDIIRKTQWINMGNLKITSVVKNRTVTLSEKDLKKRKSQAKRQSGIEKQTKKEELAKQQQHQELFKNKYNSVHNSSNSSNSSNCVSLQGQTSTTNINKNTNKKNSTKNNNSQTTVANQPEHRLTKKRKGLGKSLLGQGIGQLKSRLGVYSQRTGRGYKEENEAFTSQECCNCGRRTGPRGLRQLGVRKWVCGSQHQIGLFDPMKVKIVHEGCGTTHLRDHCAARNLERRENPIVKAHGLTQHPPRNGQAFEKSEKNNSSKTHQRNSQNTSGLSGSSRAGKNRKR